ncbi:molybdopterin-binding domain protein [Pyrolobus fumarii 1A]|uniref:Molybdopterin-binding domain protein n=1 Tax=Pyrolobus fumarii (strain DSM 11204 / 1A) TaxID=694429 RepID=G0EHK5_PYRF1|nr:nicotinamide mononucleotide deamidase-related protein [Pyrolobus fumarii]AEM39358.1 molybdopterin-binding domain protein [Pyrolobus fumarii 1A]
MTHKPIAWIINFGNELLIGRIVNTNGSWLARELTIRGFDVRRIIVAPDEEVDAVEVLREAGSKAHVVVCTGGLGPTPDDRTAEFLAKATGRKLVINEEARRMVEEKYARLGLPLTESRLKMAMLPEGATPIPNPVGTAPGIHLVHEGTHYFCLPGVPREMEAMFKGYVAKVLEGIVKPPCLVEASVVVEGVPESSMAPHIKRVMRECPECYVKSHPQGDEISNPILDIRVLVYSDSCDKAENIARRAAEAIVEAARAEGGRISEVSVRRLRD